MNRWELLSAAGTLVTLFLPIIVVFVIVLSGKHWKEAQERERARRMAEHRMNARLLRFNI
jgi:fumarate reductase subunit D